MVILTGLIFLSRGFPCGLHRRGKGRAKKKEKGKGINSNGEAFVDITNAIHRGISSRLEVEKRKGGKKRGRKCRPPPGGYNLIYPLLLEPQKKKKKKKELHPIHSSFNPQLTFVN